MTPSQHLFRELAERLEAQGHYVEPSTENLSLTLDGQLTLAGAVLDRPQHHPRLMQALLLVLHPVLFPQGIQECVVGLGDTLAAQVGSVLDNFLGTTLPPILDGLAARHHPALDFTDARGGQWHPLPGPLARQGPWPAPPAGEPLLALLHEPLRHALPTLPAGPLFHWLKVYVARLGNEQALTCQLDGADWEAPCPALAAYADSWGAGADFRGLRQFIVLRRHRP